jgi:hypothetical protein
MRAWLIALACAGAAAFVAVEGCYGPNPADGAFKCTPDLGGVCPHGLVCSLQGYCVRDGNPDGGGAPLDLAGDQATVPKVLTCDDRVMAGAFANLTALAPANTSSDEGHIALDPTGSAPRLVFQRGNQFFTANISNSNRKQIDTPQLVTLTGGPTTLQGGSFTTDGKLWFAGTDAGGATGLYAGTPSGVTAFTVAAPRAPIASGCAFTDPVFMQGDSTFQMYAAFPLAGCGSDSYVVRGALDRNAGAFYSALPESGWASPSMTSSGLMLLVSSTIEHRIYGATRSDFTYQFKSAGRIPMSAIGESVSDFQAVVSADCLTIYFSSVRAGGAGGADLYAADILPE